MYRQGQASENVVFYYNEIMLGNTAQRTIRKLAPPA